MTNADRRPTIVDRIAAALDDDDAEDDGSASGVAVGAMVDRLGSDVFGLTIALFSIPVLVPTPPPAPQICYAAMAAASWSMIVGRSTMWLPRFLRRRRLPARLMRVALEKVRPRVERACERSRPRWRALHGPGGRRVIAAATLFMIALLLLPLPIFGNFTPALATLILGLGLALEDGVVIAAGHVCAVAATAVTFAILWATIAAVLWAVG